MKVSSFLAGGAAAALAAAAVIFKLRRNAGNSTPVSFSIDRKVVIPTAVAAASIAVWMKVSHGNTLKYTFVPSMAASLAIYMLTLRNRMPDPDSVTPLYFLALAWQLVHFVEENSTGFRYRWPKEIFGAKPYGDHQ
jgi:predicted secreted protein